MQLSFLWRRLLAPLAIALFLVIRGAPAALAQSSAVASADSTSPRCMAATWLNPDMICEGRLANGAALSLLGAAAGALPGYVGGSIVRTACLGDGERAAVRGAIAGAAVGAAIGLVMHHISRRDLARRNARGKQEALRNPARPWSWRDIRPFVAGVGVVTGAGAAIGSVQGARYPPLCGGIGGGAGRGAAVYGAGAATTVVGAALTVRLLF